MCDEVQSAKPICFVRSSLAVSALLVAAPIAYDTAESPYPRHTQANESAIRLQMAQLMLEKERSYQPTTGRQQTPLNANGSW